MYKTGTILELKKPKDPDPETGEEFAYNRVEVIGESPIDHGSTGNAWEGTGARGVLIRGLCSFNAVLDEPYGKLQKLYNVEFIPAPAEYRSEMIIRATVPEDLGPTPEEIFAKEAPGDPNAPRRFAPPSPLEAPEPEPGEWGTSPLEGGEPEAGDNPEPVKKPESPL